MLFMFVIFQLPMLFKINYLDKFVLRTMILIKTLKTVFIKQIKHIIVCKILFSLFEFRHRLIGRG